MDQLDSIDDDILILTEKDLVNYKDHKTCCAKTKKGNKCKNRVSSINHGESIKLFCKRHTKQYGLEKPVDCPICMEPLTDNDNPIQCGHWIHKDCLMKCKAETCPMCRSAIKFTQEEKRIRKKLHPKNIESRDDVSIEEIYIPEEIFEFISSFIRGVPEDIRDEFLINLLQVEDESVVFGENINYQEEFSESDIEDFPDFIDM